MNPPSLIPTLVDHLFRHEAGKIIPVLTRLFGPANLDLAEDVVQDALVEAMQHWEFQGIPANPAAWLRRVTRNKALNILNRERYKQKYQATTARQLLPEMLAEPDWEHLFSEHEIQDDQLRMIFTCCHPAIAQWISLSPTSHYP